MPPVCANALAGGTRIVLLTKLSHSGRAFYRPDISSALQLPVRREYHADLTDAQWKLVEPFVRGNSIGPQLMVYSRCDVVNTLLYGSRTGVQWRYLPDDSPDWQSVYSYFRPWKKDGTLKLIHGVLRRASRVWPSSLLGS
ncbi:transposase [Hyalangium rubrum]|uniref:Transposase n=1 Tax=Hyalangium rubrum TaxID=3103134 RepID=A0ABU5GY19_9BACT|nr:transposase [Hyalangium sp. s54d21]MDY7225388.1 transposase [Hyalangium sp. s54d21]